MESHFDLNKKEDDRVAGPARALYSVPAADPRADADASTDASAGR